MSSNHVLDSALALSMPTVLRASRYKIMDNFSIMTVLVSFSSIRIEVLNTFHRNCRNRFFIREGDTSAGT